MYWRRDRARRAKGKCGMLLRVVGIVLIVLGALLLLRAMPYRAWLALFGALLAALGFLINLIFC